MVPSDIAAGIVLLYHKQTARSNRRGWSSSSPVYLHNSMGADSGPGHLSAERASEERASLNLSNTHIPRCMRTRSAEHAKFYKVARRVLPLGANQRATTALNPSIFSEVCGWCAR